MPAWIVITNADLMADRFSAWVTAVQEKASGEGQPDPTPTMIANTVAELRGMIGFRAPQLLDANTASLAPNLKSLAVEKICRLCKTWLNVPLLEVEAADERTYQKRLEDLRDGKWPVDAPLDPVPITTQGGTGFQQVTSQHRRMDARNLRGLGL